MIEWIRFFEKMGIPHLRLLKRGFFSAKAAYSQEQLLEIRMVRDLAADNDICTAIQRAVLENYAIDVQLDRLPGENLNFLAHVEDGRKFVIKIAADDQPESLIEMEYLAINHARQQLPSIHFPSIIENKFGNIETFVKTSHNRYKRLRIIEYLSGNSLEQSDISEELRRKTGISLALFDQAMEEFDHPAAHRDHRWNLLHARQHEHSIRLLQNDEKRQLLGWAYDQYKKINAGKLQHIKWQFIHGDANPENILVEGNQVVGLLDFGDSCHNPRVCELAICLPYLMMNQDDPLAAARPIIEGYESVLSLDDSEHELLAPLVLGRLATTLSVATHRRQLDPGHPNWFVSEHRAWHLLAQLRKLPDLVL